MAGQLIPPPELDPPDERKTTREQRIGQWLDVLASCESLLLAGLRRKIGPDGDLKAAFRRWYEIEMEERDRHWEKRQRALRRGRDG